MPKSKGSLELEILSSIQVEFPRISRRELDQLFPPIQGLQSATGVQIRRTNPEIISPKIGVVISDAEVVNSITFGNSDRVLSPLCPAPSIAYIIDPGIHVFFIHHTTDMIFLIIPTAIVFPSLLIIILA